MEIYAVVRPGQSQALLARFPDLDRHPHRPGDHRGELDHRFLVHREQPVPDRQLTLPEINERQR
jgi:hypothetical protein